MIYPRSSYAAALIIMLLAGCGGGSSTGQLDQVPNSTSGNYGRVTGTINNTTSALSQRAAPDTVTVSVDGTDISTQAATDGSFTLDLVPPGLQTLVASSRSLAFAVAVSVTGNESTNVGEIVLRESGQISGTVTSAASNEPIHQALVTVIASSANANGELPHPVRTRRTNDNGSYTIPSLAVGDYILTIKKDGFATKSIPITVSAGATLSEDVALAFTSLNACTIEGTITNATTHMPVVGATAYAYTSSSTLVVTAQTNSNGAYSMSLLPGSYLVHAAKYELISDTVRLEVSGNTTLSLTMQQDTAPPPPPFQ